MDNAPEYVLSSKSIMDFVRKEKIVPESAKCSIPSVVQFIVGHDYTGSWWGLPKSSLIYNALVRLRSSHNLLVCGLIKGKVTFVYHDVLPFLIRLLDELPSDALTQIREIHTDKGTHKKQLIDIVDWASNDILKSAHKLTKEDAIRGLCELVPRHVELFREIGIK